MEINKQDIDNKINNINSITNNLNEIINNIEENIQLINSIYMDYEYNKNLNLNNTNSYLKFQVDLLNNEKKYYTNIKNFLIKKFIDELYNLSENVIIILTTMNSLDINLSDEKKKIFDKILKFKKQKNINSIKIIETVNIITNNLKLIKNFIDLFDTYIVNNESINTKNNIHINNFKINLISKKQHYELEYVKCLQQFNELVNYFNRLSQSIDKQQQNQDILKFFLNNSNNNNLKRNDLNIKI
jgi:hypothetical protein